jgi:hypothetical protein
MPNPGFANPREMGVYRAPGPLSQNIPPSGIGNMPSFALSQLARPEYSQGQAPQKRQHNFQLPPIRDQGPPAGLISQRDNRSGRVDIGSLLEKPNPRQSPSN